MTAAAKGPGSDDDGSLATQWFIVSDLGLTAFSGNDGIHVFVNSLASTDAVAKAEVKLVARNNEILATRKTDESGHVLFEAGLARGEGGLSPAMLTVMSEKADYAFLSLKTNAFDLSDRGVAGRAVPAGADAFVYAGRGRPDHVCCVELGSPDRDLAGACLYRPQGLLHRGNHLHGRGLHPRTDR